MKKCCFSLMFLFLSCFFQDVQAASDQELILAAMKDFWKIEWALTRYSDVLGTFPLQEGPFDENSGIYRALVPKVTSKLPIKDPWGRSYLLYCGKKIEGQYGIWESHRTWYLLVCLGKDGKRESWQYGPSKWEAGLHYSTDPNLDLIVHTGEWIRVNKDLLELIAKGQ